MKRIAVLISGNGSNLQALIDDQKNYEIVLVISNKPNAYGLERAHRAKIPTYVPDKSTYNDDLYTVIMNAELDGIVLAGYLKMVEPRLIAAFPNRIINIHPSLIPSFCGRGYYGAKVAQAALDYGVKLTGATTHFVTECADEGPIIMQKCVAVMDTDNVDSLSQRVLSVEHEILVTSVNLFCTEQLSVSERRVRIGAST